MKRKMFALLVLLAGISLTACQEDETMNELIQDVEMNTTFDGDGDDDDDKDKPGGN